MRTWIASLAGVVVGVTLSPLVGSALLETRARAQTGDGSDDALDAVVAAPDSHILLLENQHVRVLRVQIAPGGKEPEHVHRNSSVMIVDEPSRIRYYCASGEVEYESPPGAASVAPGEVQWMEPEALHSIENVDERPYRAFRVELK